MGDLSGSWATLVDVGNYQSPNAFAAFAELTPGVAYPGRD